MADTLNITQSGGVKPAATAFDDVKDDHSEKRLGRDFVALATICLIIITYHLQNPLLMQLQFGQAWRNPTLQPVLVVALGVCVYALAGRWSWLKQDRGRMLAVGLLTIYVVYILLDVLLKFNVLAAVVGVSQDIYHGDITADSPMAALQSALNISSLLEYLALVAVIMLLAPWNRIPVYIAAIKRNAAPLLVAVVVLVLMEVLLTVFNVQQFLLPKPSVILAELFTLYDQLITVGWNTFQNAVWGFVWGCGLGIITGMLSARFTNFSKALMPLAIAANSVPIIAFAPIFNTWFGALNPQSKVAIVAVLTFFPAMISTVRGLNSVDHRSLELMRSYAATEWEIFRKLRFPNALPFIFSALKVATTLAMIGAIVSEYFGGSTKGLGYRIREDAQLFRYPESWSAIIVAALLGILFYLVVSAVERAMMPWHISFREE
ncbi:MAG: ABC transporter permease subunit [Anaerolineaceae bacterium]|nr:ABC transporter permease subunit [Anaerolineaceae bacterium]